MYLQIANTFLPSTKYIRIYIYTHKCIPVSGLTPLRKIPKSKNRKKVKFFGVDKFILYIYQINIYYMKQILTALLIILAYYGIFSFITWNFNISEWSQIGRLLYTIFIFWAISKIDDK